jgi:hypothetical protein
MTKRSHFTNTGQIIQTVLAFIACGFAAFNAWPNMSANNFLSAGSVIFIVLIVLVIYSVSRLSLSSIEWDSKDSTVEPKSSSAEDRPDMDARAPKSKTVTEVSWYQPKIFIEAPTIALGEFFQSPNEELRVTVKDIRPPENDPLGIGAELLFNVGGGVTYSGGAVTKLGVNHFFVPMGDHLGNKEPFSVFYFSFSNTHVRLFCMHVDHVNMHTKTALLSLCRVTLMKRS